MEAYVDYKMVRSVCFAGLMCSVMYFLISMQYKMIEDYIGVIVLSVFSSLPLKFMKETITTYIVVHYSNPQKLSMLSSCTLLKLIPYPISKLSIDYLKNVCVLILLIVYLSMKLQFLIGISLVLLFLGVDLILRFLGDIYNMYRRHANVQVHEGAISFLVMVSMVLFFCGIIIFLLGSVLYEILNKSQGLESVFFNPSDYTEIYEYLTDLKSSIPALKVIDDYFDSYTERTDQGCSALVENLRDYPLAYSFMIYVDDLLEYIGMSTLTLLDLTYYYEEELTTVVTDKLPMIGSVFIQILRMIFTNLVKLWEVLFFFTLVFLQVNDQNTTVSRVLSLLPINQHLKLEIEEKFNESVIKLFNALGKLAVFHYAISWFTLDVLSLNFKYTVATLSGLVALFPICPTIIVVIPHIAWSFYSGSYFEAVALIFVQWLIAGAIDDKIYNEIFNDINSTLVSLALGLGLFEFGMIGIIYGPILAATASILIQSISLVNLTTNSS